MYCYLVHCTFGEEIWSRRRFVITGLVLGCTVWIMEYCVSVYVEV
jgi:hypothetical protein